MLFFCKVLIQVWFRVYLYNKKKQGLISSNCHHFGWCDRVLPDVNRHSFSSYTFYRLWSTCISCLFSGHLTSLISSQGPGSIAFQTGVSIAPVSRGLKYFVNSFGFCFYKVSISIYIAVSTKIFRRHYLYSNKIEIKLFSTSCHLKTISNLSCLTNINRSGTTRKLIINSLEKFLQTS